MTALTYNHYRKPISGIKNLLNKAGHGVSTSLANISVALAWANGRKANPADLENAGFTKEFENRVIESMKNNYAS